MYVSHVSWQRIVYKSPLRAKMWVGTRPRLHSTDAVNPEPVASRSGDNMVRARQPSLARARDLVRLETLRRRAPATASSSSGRSTRSFAHALSPHALEQADNRHTIVLVQKTKNRSSRTFMDYEKTSLAMDAICSMFEKRLKEMYPERREIDYDVSDLYNYIDALGDLSALVYEPNINAYAPQNKEWIKKKCFTHLKKQAGGGR